MLRHLDTGDPVDLLPMLFAEEREGQGRPWIMFNMVVSVDGGTAVDGSATPLNDPDDKMLFRALRSVADYVLVGAETVRAEKYGPVRLDDEHLVQRRRAGLDHLPRLAIATRSADLDPAARAFSDPERPTMVITGVDADPSRVEALSEVAEVAQLDDLSPAGIIDHLGDADVVLCEGGPTLNGQFFATGLVDEVDLTIAPYLISGKSARIAHGETADPPLDMRLDRTLIGDVSLFLRYLRD
ncbi:MAG: dihydrofolate reductase family protein [Acidimicrobiia bacterium]